MSDPSAERDGASPLAYATATTDLKRIERRADHWKWSGQNGQNRGDNRDEDRREDRNNR